MFSVLGLNFSREDEGREHLLIFVSVCVSIIEAHSFLTQLSSCSLDALGLSQPAPEGGKVFIFYFSACA